MAGKLKFRRRIAIRLTDLQNQLIISRAMSQGCKSKSAFIRDDVMTDDFDMEQMIDEIHEVVCKKKI